MADRFPDTEGTSLSLVDHHLPSTLGGVANLLLIAFRQWQQRDVDTWVPTARALADEYPGFRVYELPVISKLYRPVAGFIDGGMRSGIPDPDVRDMTITIYLDRKRFMRNLSIESAGAIVPMLVKHDGRILWRTTGSMTDDGARTLRQAVSAAL